MANQEENSHILTKLLSDSIPDEDAFRHKKISNALFEFICDQKKGGKAIALTGGFGSGKTVVIDFLRDKFEEEKKNGTGSKTKIFTFDAWEHQGDPLRRAFIEEYVDFFEKNSWINEGEFDEELEKISKRREIIETETEPIVSKQGGIFAFLLLLVPLGLSLVRYGTIDKNLIGVNIIGFLLILCPIFYVLVLLIRFDEKKRKSVFNLFFKKAKENKRSKSLKTPEPTTIEFQNTFNKVSRRVLNNTNRRLIVVIDNIDRLTTKSSIDAWTTLRTFFENENKDWEWKDQFWLIAPFDLQELKNLWSGLDHLSNSENSGKVNNTSDYVHAFIDKTFQIMFRVPQPVLSDWKKFFEKQLRIAFPNIKEEDQKVFDDITTLYQLKGIDKGKSPTPRDIKQFINRTSALYRIWHDKDIKLSTLAFYELGTHIEEEVFVKKLKESELVDSTSRFIIGEKDLNRKLAAIHFNCELDKAYQVLYGNEVMNALQNGEAKGLEDYYETDGFRDVLKSELITLAGQKVPLSLSNSALCLKKIEENSTHNFKHLFHRLSESYKEISSIPAFEENLGKGIIAIWEKNGFTDGWIKSILRNISGSEIDEGESSIENWYEALQPIFLKLKERNKLHLLKNSLKIPGEANDYIEALSYVNGLNKQIKEEIAKYLQPNSDSDEIVKAFSGSLNSDEISGDLGTVLYLLYLSEETNVDNWNWTDLVNQIIRKIKVGSNTSSEQVEAALKMALVLCYKIEIQEAQQLSNNQNFKDGLFYLINTQGENLTGLLVLAVSFFNTENNKSTNDNKVNSGQTAYNNILKSPGDHEFIENDLFNFLIDFRLLNDFLKIQHGNNHLKKLPSQVIQQTFESEEAINLLSSTDVFEYFDDFYQHVEEEPFLDYLKTLYAREDDLVDKIKTEFETVPSHYKLHYYFAKSCPEELREPYFEFLTEGFRNLEKDQWLNHLKQETELINLAIFIQEEGFELELSIQLREALFDHFKQIYNGQIELTSQELISKWKILLDSLKDDVRVTLLHSMKDHIESDTNNEGSVFSFGKIYNPIFLENEIFLDSPERLVRTVFSRVLNAKNEDDLNWLKNLIDNEPKILNKAGPAAESFKEEVKDIIDTSDSPEAVLDIIHEIAKILGLEPNTNSQDKDEENE